MKFAFWQSPIMFLKPQLLNVLEFFWKASRHMSKLQILQPAICAESIAYEEASSFLENKNQLVSVWDVIQPL